MKRSVDSHQSTSTKENLRLTILSNVEPVEKLGWLVFGPAPVMPTVQFCSVMWWELKENIMPATKDEGALVQGQSSTLMKQEKL